MNRRIVLAGFAVVLLALTGRAAPVIDIASNVDTNVSVEVKYRKDGKWHEVKSTTNKDGSWNLKSHGVLQINDDLAGNLNNMPLAITINSSGGMQTYGCYFIAKRDGGRTVYVNLEKGARISPRSGTIKSILSGDRETKSGLSLQQNVKDSEIKSFPPSNYVCDFDRIIN